MATKKAGSTAKKTTRSKSQPAKTKVTTVKSAAARTVTKPRLTLRNTALASALIGEFVGAALLTCAFLVTKGEPLYMGFVLITLVLVVGTLSGAHLNPLVTVGAWVTRRLGHLKAATYVVAQLLGAGAAYVLLSTYITAGQPAEASALGQVGREVFQMAALNEATHWYVFGAEVLGASVFAFAFAGALREKADRVASALTVGFGLFVAMLVAGVAASYVMANVAVNPAIALAAGAVDFANVNWMALAVYVLAPLVGGVIGFALRDVVESK